MALVTDERVIRKGSIAAVAADFISVTGLSRRAAPCALIAAVADEGPATVAPWEESPQIVALSALGTAALSSTQAIGRARSLAARARPTAGRIATLQRFGTCRVPADAPAIRPGRLPALQTVAAELASRAVFVMFAADVLADAAIALGPEGTARSVAAGPIAAAVIVGRAGAAGHAAAHDLAEAPLVADSHFATRLTALAVLFAALLELETALAAVLRAGAGAAVAVLLTGIPLQDTAGSGGVAGLRRKL